LISNKKNLLYTTANQVVILIFLLLFNKIIAQVFSKEEVGEYFAIMSYSTLFSLCLFAPFNQYFQREFHTLNRIPIFNFLIFLLIPAIVSMVIIYVIDFENKALITTLVILFGLKDPFLGFFNQNFDKAILFWLNFFGGITKISFVTVPFLIYLLPNKQAISAQAFSVLIIILMSVVILVKKQSFQLFSKTKFDFIFQRRLYIISLPLIITSLIGWSRDMGVRSILSVKLTAADVASYSLMQGVSNLVPTFLLSVFSLYFLPKIFNETISFKKAAKYVCAVSIISFFILYMIFDTFSSQLVVLFLDIQYVSDGYLISSLLLPNFLFSIIGFLNSYFIFHRITSRLIAPNLIVALCLLVLMSVYIDKLGLYGVSWIISAVAIINILLIAFLIKTSRSENE
jgi:O-antigen/teichoic acid export membrane protein